MDRLAVSWLVRNLNRAIAINTDLVAVNDLKTGLISLAKVSARVSLDMTGQQSHSPQSFPHHRIRFLIHQHVLGRIWSTSVVLARTRFQYQRHNIQL